MLKVIEGKEAMEIQSYMPAGRRISFLLMALVPLLAPYELLIRPHWHSYLNGFFLFAAVLSAGALAVSALLVWAAVAGLDSTLRFDRAEGTLTYSAGAPIIPWRKQRCPIAAIAGLAVKEHDWSEGSPSYALLTAMADGSGYKIGASWSKDEIEKLVQRASAFLGLPTPPRI